VTTRFRNARTSPNKFAFPRRLMYRAGLMATQTIVHVTDDLDQSPNAETVTFGYGSDIWAIDLSQKNRTALESLLKPYMRAGRKVAGRGIRRDRSAIAASIVRRSDELAAIREWARNNGYDVSDKGRVPYAIVEAYHAASQ
jgi:hypothetical protein